MFNYQILILINTACIAFLLIMLITLVAATRMKGGAGWAALIIVTTTVPVYLSNMTRVLEADNYILFLFPAAFFNALCLPTLWFFTHSQYDKSFHFSAQKLWHTIPAFVSLFAYVVYYSSLSPEQIDTHRTFDNRTLPDYINDIIIYGQFFGYYIFIFLYIRKRKKFLQNNYSDSEYLETRWIQRFITLSFVLFFIVFLAYLINPISEAWLIPILNVILMAYLVYCVISHSTTAYINRLPDVPQNTDKRENAASLPTMNDSQMKEICDKLTEYLLSTQAYKNIDLTLAALSVEIQIHPKSISTAINGYLHRNFFELVNGMRVEEAKRQIRELSTSNYTVEGIYSDCGFRSRSAFYMAFKKFEGVSPAQWLKNNNKEVK